MMQIYKYKSWIFLAVLTGLVLILGEELGGRQGLLLSFVLALILNYIALFFSARILLWTYDAKLVEGADAYGLKTAVSKLCKKADISLPLIYILPTPSPNIFSLGYSVDSGAIAITEGALKLLTKDELQGILAHELGHIINNETFSMMVSAALSSIVMYVAGLLRWIAACGQSPKEKNHPENSLDMILTAAVAPLAALLIQLAVHKNREFAADSEASELTGNPQALASALWKIHHYSRSNPMPSTLATAHMFIINPLKPGGLGSLFSTHPPIEERIKRLSGRTL